MLWRDEKHGRGNFSRPSFAADIFSKNLKLKKLLHSLKMLEIDTDDINICSNPFRAPNETHMQLICDNNLHATYECMTMCNSYINYEYMSNIYNIKSSISWVIKV